MKKKGIVKKAAAMCLGLGMMVSGTVSSVCADQVCTEEEQLTENLEKYYQKRLSYFNTAYRGLTTNITVCSAVEVENEDRELGLKAYENSIGADFVDVQCAVQIHDISYDGTDINVDLREDVSVYYQYSEESPLEFFSFGTDHEVLLEKTGSYYTILQDYYDECMISGVDTSQGNPTQEELIAGASGLMEYEQNETGIAGTLAFYPNGYIGYNAKKAIEYADTYANGVNSYYGEASQDCANFVSQCLHAGGVAYTGSTYSTDWYFEPNSKTGSLAWVNVAAFDTHWRGYGISRVSATKQTLIPGNPFYYLPEGSHTNQHLMICVGYDSAGNPIYNAHNRNQYHAVFPDGLAGRTLYTLRFTGCTIHTYSSIYGITPVNHYKTCKNCGYQQYENHTYVNGKCSVCGANQ